MQQKVENNANENEVFQGVYGYYPCDKETFLKIKKIRKYYYEALPKAASFFRWARKSSRNRKGSEPQVPSLFCEILPVQNIGITREYKNGTCARTANRTTDWIKCDKGNGFIYIIPIEYEIRTEKSVMGEYSFPYPIGHVYDKTIIVRDFGIEAAYQQARMPKSSPEEAGKLPYTPEEIDDILRQIENNQ